MAFCKILISVGREKPMGMLATCSQEEEKIHESKNQQETPSESEARGPLLFPAASKQQLFSLLLVCLHCFFVTTSGSTPNDFHNIGHIIPCELAFKLLICFFMLWLYITKNTCILKCFFSLS